MSILQSHQGLESVPGLIMPVELKLVMIYLPPSLPMINAAKISLPVLQEEQVVSLKDFVVDMLPKLYVKQPKQLKPVIPVFGILH